MFALFVKRNAKVFTSLDEGSNGINDILMQAITTGFEFMGREFGVMNSFELLDYRRFATFSSSGEPDTLRFQVLLD